MGGARRQVSGNCSGEAEPQGSLGGRGSLEGGWRWVEVAVLINAGEGHGLQLEGGAWRANMGVRPHPQYT